jgi:putative hydrolase of the HAD superfamily
LTLYTESRASVAPRGQTLRNVSQSTAEPPKVVSFDCAQTLLAVDWSVRRYVADLCAAAELEIPLHGPALYEEMYHARLRDYVRVNMTRDHDQCDAWWIALGEEWLAAVGLDPAHSPNLQAVSLRIGFGPESILFKLYEDVLPALDRLRAQGIRTAVLSNWDYTLHRSLKLFGLDKRFELVVASLEHGVEKPDPRLFQVVIDHFGVDPSEILHVGDNPVDDFDGAKGVGMRAVLIDRTLPQPESPWINDLADLEGVFAWTD